LMVGKAFHKVHKETNIERERWRIPYRLTRELDKPRGEWRYATADVLVAYFWTVVHARPNN
jgi:hypothetical protein